MSVLQNIKSISQSGVASVFNILLSIIRVKFVAIFLGPNGVAIIGQLTNFLNITSFISNLGMQNGLINEVALTRVNDDQKLATQYKQTFFLVNVWASLAMALIMFFFSSQVSEWLFNSKENYRYVRIVCFYIFTAGLVSSYLAFLSAYKLVKTLMYVSIIGSFLSVTSAILLIYFFRIDGAVISLSVNIFINLIITLYFLWRHGLESYLFSLLRFDLIKRQRFLSLLKYGGLIMTSSIIYKLLAIELVNIVIENEGLEAAGYYQASISISKQYMPIFVSSFSVYLLPHLSEQKSKLLKVQELNSVIRILLIIITPVLIVISTFNIWIIEILYTPEFKTTASLISILIVSDYIGLINKVFYTMAISIKRLKFLFLIDFFLVVFMYLFSSWFYNKFGLLTVIFAHLAASILYFIFSSVYLYKRMKFLLSKANFLFGISSVIALTILAFQINDILFKIGFSLAYLMFSYSFLIRKKERAALKNLLLSQYNKFMHENKNSI